MCLPERNTDNRGRPPAFWRNWKRRRSRRRSRRSCLALMLLLLAFLASDLLVTVAHALAFVGLGRAERPDLRRHLADQALAHPFHLDRGRPLTGDLDALRHRIVDRVGKAEADLQPIILHRS